MRSDFAHRDWYSDSFVRNGSSVILPESFGRYDYSKVRNNAFYSAEPIYSPLH